MKRFAAGLSLLALATTGACSVDGLRKMESNEDITGPALVQEKQVFDDGCLAYVFSDKALADVMAAMPDAVSIPPKDTGSPTATAAWKVGSRNQAYVMQLPNGRSCSASILYGDPQRLYDAAVAFIQTRGAFTKGEVDKSARGDAERTTWCTAGPYPYVAVLLRRTTGTRPAFLANVFKAQGITLNECRPNG